jgi:hypothetical protein
MNAADLLRPLLSGTPAGWRGLPRLATDAFDAALGPPVAVACEDLGYYPAERRTYCVGGHEVFVWAREGAAVMVEVAVALPESALGALGAPSAVLPNEILVEGGYAHEYLYCPRGLVATVVQPYRAGALKIVRLRGVAPLDRPDAFGPDLYKAFEDRVSWAGAAGAIGGLS